VLSDCYKRRKGPRRRRARLLDMVFPSLLEVAQKGEESGFEGVEVNFLHRYFRQMFGRGNLLFFPEKESYQHERVGRVDRGGEKKL